MPVSSKGIAMKMYFSTKSIYQTSVLVHAMRQSNIDVNQ